MKLRMRYALAVMAVGVTILTACTSTTSSGGNSGGGNGGSKGSSDTIIEAVPTLPTSYAYDAGDFTYAGFEFQINTNSQLIQNPLETVSDGDQEENLFKFQGELAQSYDVSPDGRTYTFHLRKGVKSSHGNLLTADDVVWTYARKFSKNGGVTPFITYPAIVDPKKQIKEINKYTVSFTVSDRGEGFTLLSLLANVSADIYDATFLKSKATPSDPYAIQWSAKNGNYGFGAYDLANVQPGQQLTLKANPNYYAGEPKIKTVIQKVVPDPAQRAALLASGAVDIAVQLRPSDVHGVEGNKNITTFDGLHTVQYADMILNTTGGVFKNVAVRQALRYAIPYDQINQNVYYGKLTPQMGFINMRYPNADLDGLKVGTYDPAKAKQMLAAAGIKTPVKYTIMVDTGVPDLGQIGAQIQSAASDAGFQVELQNSPSAAFANATSKHNYEAALVHINSISQSPPYELMLAFTKDSPLNTTGWVDQEFYKAVNQGVAAGDALSAGAAKYWNKAQLIYQQQTPDIALGFFQPLLAVRSDIKGYYNRTDQTIDFSKLSKG